MSAKGYITGNDAADRILRDEVPCSEKALRRVMVNERNRTIAEFRGKFLCGPIPTLTESERVFDILDRMEQAS
jgi:hypothetical protein